jgi:pilus assembly protein CpaB
MLARHVLIVTGVLALLVGVAVSLLSLRQREASVPGPVVVHQSVLAAAHPVGTGSLLRPEDMVWKDVTAAEVQPGNIVRDGAGEAEFVGAVSRRDFQTGEPFLADALVKPNTRGFLAVVLTPGNLAMSIGVDPSQSLGGLIMPGDHVDVLLTQAFSEQATDAPHRTVGETILRDIRVIAVDQTLSALDKPVALGAAIGVVDQRGTPRTLTLDVTGQQAQTLLVASQLGKIGIAVRALGGGAAQPEEAPTWAADVSPALRAIQTGSSPSPSTSSGPAGTTPTSPIQGTVESIEVIHGSKIERLCQRGTNLVPCQ